MYENLETERLKLRKFTEEDELFVYELMGNDIVCEYFPGKKGYSYEICKKLLNYYIKSFGYEDKQRIYLVSTKEDEPIGYVGIQIVKEYNKYEIFYALKPEYWGFGYATEAAYQMVELAKLTNINDLIALADIENPASQNVLEKIGYKKEKQIHMWELDLFFYTMNI